MRLNDITIRQTDDARRVRLTADVAYDTPGWEAERYWFEVPADLAQQLSTSANPWLAALAPVAATLGEALMVEAPADPELIDNLGELLRMWTNWYPSLQPVRIRTDSTGPAAPRSGEQAASFFSGGVDSFFTALRHAQGNGTPRSVAIDDLIFVHGFDIPLRNEAAFHRVRNRLETAARLLSRRLVVVATNLRETRFARADWQYLAHGAALAAVGLVLEPRYREILIPSSAGYRDLRFWGSHPLTDPLFSTSRTQVTHDGPAFMRAEKTEYVAQFPLALDTLRVCWKSETGDNCSRCNNCFRTMLTLEALGALERCPTFDAGALDLERASRVYCPNPWDVRQYGYVRDLANRRGREDIAGAITRSLRGSARLARWLASVDRLRGVRGGWRIAPWLRRRLLAGWIQ